MFLRTVAAGPRRRTSTAGIVEHHRRSLTAMPEIDRRKSSFTVLGIKHMDRCQSVVEEKQLQDAMLDKLHHQLLNVPESLIPKFSPEFRNSEARSLSLNTSLRSIRSEFTESDASIAKPMPTKVELNERRLTFRVSGQMFETFESTLSIFPDTLLGDKVSRDRCYNERTNSYVINRCHRSFSAVLFYYQSNGILSRPLDINREDFLQELEFYNIQEFIDARHRQEAKFVEQDEKNKQLPKGRYRQIIWKLLEYQERSRISQFCFYLYFVTSVLSIVIFCAETEPQFKGLPCWNPLETVVNILFTIEYILRLYSAPCIKDFICSAFGLVDFLAIVPFYCNAIIRLAGNEAVSSLSALTLLRVLRVFKLTRCNEGLRILMMTIYESLSHLRSLFVCIGITSLFFATILFYIESDQLNISQINNFKSIPDSFWYTVITATAVGYGDMYPKTPWGKLVGSILASVGLLLFCLPTPMLVNKFVECYYIRMTLTKDVDPHRKAVIKRMRETFVE